jgi:hypothetical protein
MPYQLCEQVLFCVTGGRAVFLDARRDRYFCLNGDAELAFRALLNAEPTPPKGLKDLVRSQLIEEGEGGGPPMAAVSPARPTRSVLEEPSAAAIRRAGAIEVAWRVAAARARVKRRAFAAIVDHVQARKPRAAARTASDAPLAWAAAFNTARRIAPIKPLCLPDSLALLDFLAHRRVFADLVLGVKLNPFGAHCWVQTDQVILNDAVDRVNAHTPILVV